jgi:hypothetical protein
MSEMSVLFGRPSRGPSFDDGYELEVLAAEELDVESYAIHLDGIVNGDAERSLMTLPRPAGRTWVYRGWMLDEAEYTLLYDAILDRGEQLHVDPDSFALTSLMPNYLPILGDRTPQSVWTESESVKEAWEVAQSLGAPPWVVKDHVKSAKEHWHRACFVPASAGFEDFRDVCEELLAIRGDRFERGFVIRRFVELAPLRGFTPDGRRVPDEHRLVFWNGELVAHAPIYDVDASFDDARAFEWLGDEVDSPFFVADVARLSAGGFTVVELNDGGSAILPERLDPRELYRAIAE